MYENYFIEINPPTIILNENTNTIIVYNNSNNNNINLQILENISDGTTKNTTNTNERVYNINLENYENKEYIIDNISVRYYTEIDGEIVYGDFISFDTFPTLNYLTVPIIKCDYYNNFCNITHPIEEVSISYYYCPIDNEDEEYEFKEYVTDFPLPISQVCIKAKATYKSFYSDITIAYFYATVDNGVHLEYEPNIKLIGSEDIKRLDSFISCYVDIINNLNYNKAKVLNSISYILNKKDEQEGDEIPFNTLKEKTSGDNIIIYTDECYTGNISINTDNAFNILNNYKLPFYEKGKWNLNYFRNKITTDVTEEELEEYTTFPYYDIKNREINNNGISLDKLKATYAIENNKYKSSDLRSLIFGKYFVARFIFKNKNKIKFDNILFNINLY